MWGLIPWRKNRNGGTALATRVDNPVDLFREFREDFDSLFNRFFDNLWPMPVNHGWNVWGVETEETDNEVIVRLDAPGFETGDFDVQVCGETLKVSAERKSNEGDKRSFERRFYRTMTLPGTVDPEKVEAVYRNGVLELKLPKTEQAKWKKIPIKS